MVDTWSPDVSYHDGRISFACIDNQGRIVIVVSQDIIIFNFLKDGRLTCDGQTRLSKPICAMTMDWPYVVTACWDDHHVKVINVTKDHFPVMLELEIPIDWVHHITSLALTSLLTTPTPAAVTSSDTPVSLHLIAGLGNGMVLAWKLLESNVASIIPITPVNGSYVGTTPVSLTVVDNGM